MVIVCFCCYWCSVCPLSNNRYCYYERITVVTGNWLQHSVLKFDLSFVLHVPRASSFTSTLVFVMNFDDWLLWLSRKCIIFWYSIFSLHIFLIMILKVHQKFPVSFLMVCMYPLITLWSSLCSLFRLLFPTRSPVTSAVVWIALFKAVLRDRFPTFLLCQEGFVHTFCSCFCSGISPCFLQRIRICSFCNIFDIWV